MFSPARLRWVWLLVLAVPAGAWADEGPAVDFNRDIRPILSDTCFKCHGPDEKQRQAELRLDTKEGLFADGQEGPILVAGKAKESELFRRISSSDAEVKMPPAGADKKLTGRQIELIRRWIEQGAKWKQHWSFVAPRRPKLPKISDVAWPRNPIDYFVLARLEREGPELLIRPSPEAAKTTLIRRVTLDLTGLPPTPEEVDAFLADESPGAYERLVDRLLASPRYGERMAVPWLYAARYADTSGYQNDGPRSMWRWRDWVIDAYNANMSFDQFTIEQLAGDLLPEPTLSQRIATAFNRNHRGNAEGGIIAEEYQVEYVVDRVETTFTVWQGLTFGCARCHHHKFDPLQQDDFYRTFAYFNNIPEYGRAIKEGNSPPFLKAPTEEQRRKYEELGEQLSEAFILFTAEDLHSRALQRDWEKEVAKGKGQGAKGKGSSHAVDWAPDRGLIAHFRLDDNAKDATGTAKTAKFAGGSAAFEPGRLERAGRFDGKRFVDAGDVANFGYFDKFSFGAWVYAQGDQGGTILSRMTEDTEADGYYLRLVDGRLQVNLVKRWLDDSIRVETERKFQPGRWHHVMVTYDGSRVAEGITLYVDGRDEKLKVNYDFLNQTFASKEPLRIGGGGGPTWRFHGRIDDVRVYDRCLNEEEVQSISVPETIREILAIAAERRSAFQAGKLRAYYLKHHAPRDIRQLHQRLVDLRERTERLYESFPTVMVMQEMREPRPTHVLQRGQYDKPGERVTPGVPSSLPPLPQGAPNNRLGLARWLVDPANPLTARVTVNRYWQMLFGTGLVKTAEDFGIQGERPSHPRLLDWLATEFVRGGWDVKAMLRLMVTSATYRQSSRVTPALHDRDPDNRLLARGPRFRLSAETVRDQALAFAGLLTERLGGPSVKPYQPPGLWEEIATDTNYDQSHGADLYRRGLYTYWKRTVTPPNMAALDAGPREMCTLRLPRTNTPLQALTLMNDVTFVEASRVLAQRILTHGGDSPRKRIHYAFRLVTSREPKPAEEAILLRGLQFHLARYSKDRPAAEKLVSAGEYPRDKRIDVKELAAYTAFAGLILNLDEVVTKE